MILLIYSYFKRQSVSSGFLYFSFFAWALMSFSTALKGQDALDPDGASSEENYYMFPIRPGLTNYLAGSMGELRSNHFHGGLDIKTGGVEGLPVYAAADGYINRINVSSFGYGNTLYIQHPNGTTTVYAHLQKFAVDIHHYVKYEQYKRESFSLELQPGPEKFKVTKGQIIALSGNSGSSGGPHLHFEIRDKNQKPINPLRYNFPEIKDNIPPTPVSIAIKTLEPGARINDQFGYFIFDLQKTGKEYSVIEPIHVTGKVGVEILTYDQMNGSSNKNGVPYIDLYFDEKKIFGQKIETFSFYESRNILVHCNFQTMQETGKRYNKLYVDYGNELSFYESLNRGFINIKDTLDHSLRVDLLDAYRNPASVHVKVKGGKASSISKNKPDPGKSGYVILDKTLKIFNAQRDKTNNLVKIFANRMAYEMIPSYSLNKTDVYLWDLRHGLPDSLDLCGDMIYYDFKKMIPSYREMSYFDHDINALFPKRALFDTLFLKVNYQFDEVTNREIFQVNEDLIPLRNGVTLSLKPRNSYDDKPRTSAYSLSSKGNPSYVGGNWKDELFEIKTRSFGRFTLLTDSIPPEIKPIKATSTECRFQIKDELSGLRSFKATINDQWVLMNYDHKRKLIWSEKSDNTIPFKGDFKLLVVDNAGNEAIYTAKF